VIVGWRGGVGSRQDTTRPWIEMVQEVKVCKKKKKDEKKTSLQLQESRNQSTRQGWAEGTEREPRERRGQLAG